jgi:hypothetical protein
MAIKVYNVKNGGRVYEFEDGAICPSVTSVINILGGKNLIGWAVNECVSFLEAELKSAKPYEIPHLLDDLIIMARKRHNVVRDTAGSRGTDIHKAVEGRLRGHDIPEYQLIDTDGNPTLTAKVLDNFDTWREGCNFVPLTIANDLGVGKETIEVKVRSKKHNYAGTADLMGQTDHLGVVLADLKTGKSVHKSMKLQLAAYAHAIGEAHGIYPDNCFVLHVLPSGHIKEKLKMDRDEYDKQFEIFLDLLNVYRWYTDTEREP